MKSFSHAEGGGGGTTNVEVVLPQKLEVLDILKGVQQVLPCLEGGGGGGANSFVCFPF